jgi:hypothetical protein
MMTLLRPTTQRKIASGARHALALLFSLAFFAAGGVIVWYNRTALTIPLLVGALVCFVFSTALALPANFREIVVFIVPYLPDALVGGRRKTDPQPPPAP